MAAGSCPGALGHLAGESVDHDVAEQALGVRLRGGEGDRQVREPGADDDEGRALLADLVAGAAQGAELGPGDVLHLVDEQGDADAQVAGEGRHVGEQLDQVQLEVAGVRASLGGDDVGGWLPAVLAGARLAVLELGAQRERLQYAGHLVDPVGVAVPVGQLADSRMHGLGERKPQRLVGARLELAGAPGALYGEAAQRVEKYRLAHAAEP